MQMCVCSYCFLCSQFAAAVETEHNASNFIHLGKKRGRQKKKRKNVQLHHQRSRFHVYMLSDVKRKQFDSILRMSTTNPDVATKFWALGKNRSHRILHLINVLQGKEMRRWELSIPELPWQEETFTQTGRPCVFL